MRSGQEAARAQLLVQRLAAPGEPVAHARAEAREHERGGGVLGHGDTRDDLLRAAGWAASRPGVAAWRAAARRLAEIATKFLLPRTSTRAVHCLRPIVERQLAVRAEDSDDDDDPDRTYAFPPPIDLDAYAAACRLPPAEETEDEREARFQRERCFGL